MGEPIQNVHHFSKLQKQRRKKKKNLDPLLSNFISSSFFVCFKQFKKLWKRYLKLYKPFWNGNIIKWRHKILSSKIQTSDNCQPTSPWPPSLGEGISCSNLDQFEQFLLHWMHHLRLYKIFENNRVTSKDLRLQNVNWSYVTTHIMPMTPFIWRMHILFKPLSIWAIFAALVAPSKVLQHIFGMQG